MRHFVKKEIAKRIIMNQHIILLELANFEKDPDLRKSLYDFAEDNKKFLECLGE